MSVETLREQIIRQQHSSSYHFDYPIAPKPGDWTWVFNATRDPTYAKPALEAVRKFFFPQLLDARGAQAASIYSTQHLLYTPEEITTLVE